MKIISVFILFIALYAVHIRIVYIGKKIHFMFYSTINISKRETLICEVKDGVEEYYYVEDEVKSTITSLKQEDSKLEITTLDDKHYTIKIPDISI